MSTILIRNAAILTPAGWILDGFLVIKENKIEAIEAGDPPDNLVADEIIFAENSAVIPGMLNGHTHLSQTFMRGLAEGRTLIEWLKERIWPLQKLMTPEILSLAAKLGLLENIRCGATSVVDHHKITTTSLHTDMVLKAAEEIGLNFTLARSWSDMGINAESAVSIREDLERLYREWQGRGNICIADGPLSTWRCSAETLKNMHELSIRNGGVTHIHAAETQEEVQMCTHDYQLPPIAWLDNLGVLDGWTQVVHAVWVDSREIDMLVSSKSPVVHCPVSNAVLASGIAPLDRFREEGVSLRLGTDGPASGDTQDIWETIKSALLMNRASSLNTTKVNPSDVLAMGLSSPGLAPGDRATMIIVDLSNCRAMPVYDVVSALVLSTHGSDVNTVIIDGKFLIKYGRVLFLDEQALLKECRQAALILRRSAGF